jgi:long-chain fatty acid transport protein
LSIRFLAILVGSLCSLAAASAVAQNAPAGAGRTAAADNASTVNTNPAGIMRLDRFEVAFNGVLAASPNHFQIDRNLSTESGGNPKNDDEIVGIPALGMSLPIGDRFAVGLGFSIPTGFGSDYGKHWAGRYLAQESQLVFMSLQPVAAVRVTDWLSVSAGASIMYTSSKTKVAINQGVGEPDGNFRLEVDGVSAGPVLGLLLEPTPTLRFGADWRGEIDPNLSGKPEFGNLTPATQLLVDTLGLTGNHVDIDMRSPQNASFGFDWQVSDDVALMGDFTWIDWSRFGRVEIQISDLSGVIKSEYKDIYLGTLGIEYRFNERYAAALGFTYVSPGVSNKHRTLSFPLDDYYVTGIGLDARLSEHVDVQTNLNVLVGGDGSIDQGQAGSRTGRVVGEFDRRLSVVLQTSFVWRR